MTTRTQIYVRDPDGATVEYEIKQFRELSIVLNNNAVSSWQITAQLDLNSLALARPGAGVIIEGDGFSISGPRDDSDEAVDVNGDMITISGKSDDTYLWERLAYPCNPTQVDTETGPTYYFREQTNDVRVGAGETIMYQYAIANLGGGDWSSGGQAARAVPGISFAADLGRGQTVNASARWDVLGDLLAQIALAAGGLRFGITDLQMWIDETRDRSNEIDLSIASRSIQKFQYTNSGPRTTHVLSAGSDLGTNRVCLLSGDENAATAWRRIESFKDDRNAAGIEEMYQNVAQAIVDGAETSSLTVTPAETDALRFGYDYGLGDIVSYETTTAQGADVIRQVQITVNDQGRLITPSIQTQTSKAPPSALMIVDQLKLVQERVSALERSQ